MFVIIAERNKPQIADKTKIGTIELCAASPEIKKKKIRLMQTYWLKGMIGAEMLINYFEVMLLGTRRSWRRRHRTLR